MCAHDNINLKSILIIIYYSLILIFVHHTLPFFLRAKISTHSFFLVCFNLSRFNCQALENYAVSYRYPYNNVILAVEIWLFYLYSYQEAIETFVAG